MRSALTLGSRAVGMYQSDDPRETWIAAVLGAVAVGLVLWQFRGVGE